MTRRMPHLALPVGTRDHAIGAVHAPITLVQYGDYQCPHCAAAHLVVEEIVEALDHKVRYVYRHFPSRDHPRALAAALAAEAAGAQARFWEMHERLFAFRDHLEDDALVEHARRLGLDVPRFAEALVDRAVAAKIDEDVRSAEESGVTRTPGFFINGVCYDGPYDLHSMLAAVRAAIV